MSIKQEWRSSSVHHAKMQQKKYKPYIERVSDHNHPTIYLLSSIKIRSFSALIWSSFFFNAILEMSRPRAIPFTFNSYFCKRSINSPFAFSGITTLFLSRISTACAARSDEGFSPPVAGLAPTNLAGVGVFENSNDDDGTVEEKDTARSVNDRANEVGVKASVFEPSCAPTSDISSSFLFPGAEAPTASRDGVLGGPKSGRRIGAVAVAEAACSCLCS